MLRSTFKQQVVQAKGKFQDPLGQAMLEWYQGLPDERQLELEEMAVQIMSKVKRRNPEVQMGVKGALSVIGALVAMQEGWVRYGQE